MTDADTMVPNFDLGIEDISARCQPYYVIRSRNRLKTAEDYQG